MLKQAGVHQDRVIEVLRGDGESESKAFIEVWDEQTPATQSIAGLEPVALAADITPRRLWELFCGAAMDQSRQAVSVQLVMALPDVVAVTIKGAKQAKGHLDREHLYKMSGSLPTPKGSVTTINLNNEQKEQIAVMRSSESCEPPPDMDDYLKEIQEVVKIKALPSGIE